jgi:hypothetical protein
LYKKVELSVVAHACNPSYKEGVVGRIDAQGQWGQKCKSLSEKKRKIEKKLKQKGLDGGMDELVECLLCKQKTMSSNPRITKKKKKVESSKFNGLQGA